MIIKYFQKLLEAFDYLISNQINEGKFLRQTFKNKKIILFDIGANYGNYYDYVKKKINIKAAYFFEPQIKCYDYLKDNLKTDGVIKVLEKLAVSNKRTTKMFYEYDLSSVSSLNKKNFESYKLINKYNTQTIDLDYYLKINKIKQIDILKIDVEGEDYNVLLGCRHLLKNKKIKVIKIELSFETYSKKLKYLHVLILNLMQQYNYKLIGINRAKYYKNTLTHGDFIFSLN